MKRLLHHFRPIVLSATSCCAIVGISVFAQQASAQHIRADGTLESPTGVESVDDAHFKIGGGTRLGNNLFHSFERFSIPAQGSAVFNNAVDVANIISRVTGNQASNIDGLIETKGQDANLFFLNRNGIVFGPDAQLKVGGSFVASTAESLRFSNGIDFVSNGDRLNPLLSVSVPTGLQLGEASKRIEVNGSGYTTLSETPLKVNSSAGFSVGAGRTLALIGRAVDFDGGVVAAPGGHIEIGSVQSGLVRFGEGAKYFDYRDAEQFGKMTFSRRSLMDASSLLFNSAGSFYASGERGGSIQLQGENILFQGGSRALIQNYGAQASGNIKAAASDTFKIVAEVISEGRDPGLVTMSFGAGAGGHIEIIAPNILLKGDVSVGTDTFGPAASGRIVVTANQLMKFEVDQSIVPEGPEVSTIAYSSGAAGDLDISAGDMVMFGSGLTSRTLGSGASGLIKVAAERIALEGGGSISSSTLISGQGGDVDITADMINIGGVNPDSFVPSLIEAPTIGLGNAGSVSIYVRQLNLREGGRIGSSTLAYGDAGTVTITASDAITVDGTVPGSVNPSLITSAANVVDLELQQFFEAIGVFLPAVPTGNGGNITLNTPRLSVSNGAQVTARNDGSGNAGTLTANAGSIYLSDRAGITASTQQGGGGNIVLNLQDSLLLRRGSRLSAEAGGSGNGGNIVLNAPVIVALENSDITASAVQGAGGNIQINARAILGTAFRNQPTPESDITASSRFGVRGEVAINAVENDVSSGTVALPKNVTDPDGQIIAGCSNAPASQFVASGRGGLPSNPMIALQSTRLWSDVRETEPSSAERETVARASRELEALPTEAVDWIVNDQGQVALVDALNARSFGDLSSAACLKE